MLRKILLSTLVAASFGDFALTAAAQRPNYATVAPPEARTEAMPAPRRGKEWSPGHYQWKHGQYVWTRGHWVNARRGQHYEPAHWVERNGRWYMEAGRWVARNDRDGDGIRNKNDRDRDGDGVRNRNDRAPNNPNRS